MSRASLWMVAAAAVLAAAASAQDQAPAVAAGAPEAVVLTDKGTFVIRLLPEVAPLHVKHFVATARKGGFDHTTFHRVIAGGIIQGGDPLSKDPAKKSLYGTGGLGLLKAEFSDRPFQRGTVAAVLRPSSKDSGGNQFFVCLAPQPSLTGHYTVFGEVVEGMEVADAIGNTPVVGKDTAAERVEIRSVTLREAAPSPAP